MTSKTVDVSELWTRLGEMEREARFNGRSYPEGMCKFPFRLSGLDSFLAVMGFGDKIMILRQRPMER